MIQKEPFATTDRWEENLLFSERSDLFWGRILKQPNFHQSFRHKILLFSRIKKLLLHTSKKVLSKRN